MAGGEGKRLRPYTENIPKSLAKIGNTTLIEKYSNIGTVGITKGIYSCKLFIRSNNK